MKKNKFPGLLMQILRILLPVVMVLLLGYGILLTVIGSGTKRELNDAAANYPSVTVRIAELRRSENLSRSLIVVLKPENEQDDLPEQLGQTIATTTNQKLSVGDRLTMYYDPAHPQTRIIDFGTAGPLLRAGGLLTGSALLILLIWLAGSLIRRKKHGAPTAIAENR